jgi:GTP:adenosylcobinamide-phosphate guanylyltransferase
MNISDLDPTAAFHALVLAGERKGPDPLTAASGGCCKALVPVGGIPMLLRVIDALTGCVEVDSILMSGPRRSQLEQNRRLADGIAEGRWGWRHPEASPSASAWAALQTFPRTVPVLLTTADHALLRAEIVDHFCGAARRTGCDVAVALVDHRRVISAFPDTRRTALRFRGGACCGCNLYALLTPESRSIADFWQGMEDDRKRPWRIARRLGWVPLLAYLTRRLSLEDAFRALSDRTGLRVCPVLLPFAEAAVDIDTPGDRELAERVLLASPDPSR